MYVGNCFDVCLMNNEVEHVCILSMSESLFCFKVLKRISR